jgi:hypothetical protein
MYDDDDWGANDEGHDGPIIPRPLSREERWEIEEEERESRYW